MGAESLFRSTCVRYQPAVASSSGMYAVSYTSGATVTSGIRCEIQAAAGRIGQAGGESMEFGRVVNRTQYTGWFRYDQTLALRDRLVWRSKTLEVKSAPRDPTGVQDHVEVDLEEVL